MTNEKKPTPNRMLRRELYEQLSAPNLLDKATMLQNYADLLSKIGREGEGKAVEEQAQAIRAVLE